MSRCIVTKDFVRLGVAFAWMLALVAFGAIDAQAQATKVDVFECTANQTGVDVDIKGLGNQNVCIVASTTVEANCACVGGGNNCPRDANKQTFVQDVASGVAVEPKNGRVNQIIAPTLSSTASCDNLSCPSGQTAQLISFDTTGITFTACTTTAAANEPCSCAGQNEIAEVTCGSQSQTVFPGRRGSCEALFQD